MNALVIAGWTVHEAFGRRWIQAGPGLALAILARPVRPGPATSRSRLGRVRVASLVEYVLAAVLVGLNASVGALGLVFNDVAWRSLPGGRPVRVAMAVLGGLALAAPLLVVFGALFASADAVFGRLVVDL